jgi:hypothetical protein
MRENRTYGSEGGEPSNGSLPYPYVRLCVLHIRSVQVRFRVTSSSVVEGNCVTVRWGGEQPEANDQSVG